MNQAEQDAINALDLDALRTKYSPQPVPLCRVCGGQLQMSYMGKGRTEWTCSTISLEDITTEAGARHYNHSREIIIDRSDLDVIHLLNALGAARAERDALAAQLASERKAAERIAIRAREAIAGEIDAEDALSIIIDLTGA